MSKPESGFIRIGNANLYYELAGRGQLLVLIHAGVADNRQWDNEFAYFSQDFRVLRYDLRGYGKSLPVEGEFSHTENLTALLDELGINQPLVLIGCSMGGGLAMDFALVHSTKMKALVLLGSAPSGLALDVPDHPKMDAAEQAYNSGDLDLLAELETQIWFDGMGRTPQQVNQEMRGLAKEMDRLALAHEAKGLGKRLPDAQTKAAERLHELKMPVLLVVGEHDVPYVHAAADYVVEHVPSARKVIIEDAAHLANMDQPEPFQSVVRSFLDEMPQ